MKPALILIIVLAAVPALATDYEVWGFTLEGNLWVKQPAHCLKTPDLKQATNYANSVNIAPGWCATTNIPNYVAPKPATSGRTLNLGDWSVTYRPSTTTYQYNRGYSRGRSSAYGYMGARTPDAIRAKIVERAQMQAAFPDGGY
ncbi:MAG: hypothetical protein WCJ35_11605 [Planctomycetota bacterium]